MYVHVWFCDDPVQPKRDARLGHRVRAQRAATRLRASASVALSHTAPQQHVEILAHSGRTSPGLFTMVLYIHPALDFHSLHYFRSSYFLYSLFNPAPASKSFLSSDFSFL